MEKVFLVRLDAIGDLALTLPVDKAPFLDPDRATDLSIPKDIVWIINESLGFMALHSSPQREYLSCAKTFNEGFWHFFKTLRTEKPQKIVFFYAPWWAYFAAWLARIKYRHGRLSQWYSFLFLNRGLRQSRVRSEKSELEYNWDLIHAAFGKKVLIEPPHLTLLRDATRSVAQQLCEKWHLVTSQFVVVHVGMAGSALNWPIPMYKELIDRILEETNLVVVMTGTKLDEAYLKEFRVEYQHHPRIRWTQSALSAPELLYILKLSSGVVAPSTGVLHLAAAVGVRTIGIYCPVPSMHPRRWAPQGPNVQVLLPLADCPASTKCLGETCPKFYCMKEVTVDQVFKALVVENKVKS